MRQQLQLVLLPFSSFLAQPCLSQPQPPTATAVGAVVMPSATAYPAPPPLVLAEAIPLDEEEQRAISAVPADWSGAVVAGAVVLPMGQVILG